MIELASRFRSHGGLALDNLEGTTVVGDSRSAAGTGEANGYDSRPPQGKIRALDCEPGILFPNSLRHAPLLPEPHHSPEKSASFLVNY